MASDSDHDSTTELLDEFRAIIARSQKDFLFTCSGSLSCDNDPKASEDANPVKDPVTIRWDPSDASTPASQCKITFPADSESLSALIGDMQQATFGLGGKDVLDESYRKALKLDTTAFSTNFCPYTAGIMDTVSRILVPSVSENQTCIVRAELYKLNIYEGPSGHFRSHVDTPRSSSQFGSLVVCLPAAHSGGGLVVSHKGKTINFDWGSATSPAVQWAAFYSDCEHEVLQVLSGQRVTLTYNLYACKTSPEPDKAVLNTPLAKHLEALLSNDKFMPEGGFLGFHAAHAYPHSSRSFQANTKSAPGGVPPLKGIDHVLWQTATALGFKCFLRPVIGYEAYEDGEDESSIVQGIGQRLAFDTLGGEVECLADALRDDYLSKSIHPEDVEWLNHCGRKNQEVALAYTAYGNQASTEYVYSYCAILIQVQGQGSETDEDSDTGMEVEPASPPVISSAPFGG
ncbi:putative 2og-fe oxygenase family protein [Rhypophila decipiens]|uniref:2og-fe oxygenase family protein n=1 Tax=Rhypophila decipiens TaxID=261697 RepID=A0AAN6YFK1_9PEZI|nr:putative 2og-fe oxygenase family protein [Rhypophila decipiens]